MALPYNNFFGELDGKSIYDFIKQLDYSIVDQKDRIKLIDNIINTQKTGRSKLPDSYFEEYFEQKDTKEGINASHIKICISTKDNLSDKSNVCKALEKMADYILFAPNGEKVNKKNVTYNFYTDEKLFKKMQKEKSIEDMSDKIRKTEKDSDCKEEVIDFLIKKNQNYKKEIKQQIYKGDLHKKELKCLNDYEKVIKYLGFKLRICNLITACRNRIKKMKKKDKYKLLNNINNKTKIAIEDYINKKIIEDNMYVLKNICSKKDFLIKHKNAMIDDQILLKDKLLGTIYFKQVLSDTCMPDYDKFDFTNKEHVLALIKFKPRINLTDDLACLTQDLEQLLQSCTFKEREVKILKLWRDDMTQENIAEMLKISQPEVNRILNRICEKVIDKFEETYENWYYLNIKKGKYKKCSCCGKIYLANERYFNHSKNSKDGWYPQCKMCRSKSISIE